MVKILNSIKAGLKPVTVRQLISKGPVIAGCKAIIAGRCFTSILSKSDQILSIQGVRSNTLNV